MRHPLMNLALKVKILQFLTTFTQLNTRPKKFFIGLVIGLEHRRRSCKMCDSVRQKLGHTNVPEGTSEDPIHCGPIGFPSSSAPTVTNSLGGH